MTRTPKAAPRKLPKLPNLPPPDIVGLLQQRLTRLLEYVYMHYPPMQFLDPDPSLPRNNSIPPNLPTLKAFELLHQSIPQLAQQMASEIELAADIVVDPRLRNAVLARHSITARWPRPDGNLAADLLETLVFRLSPPNEPPRYHQIFTDDGPLLTRYWPAEVAVLDVASWAGPALNKRSSTPIGDMLIQEARKGLGLDDWIHLNGVRIPILGIALLYMAEREVLEGARKPAIAVDASRIHHTLIGGMQSWPRDSERHKGAELEGRVTQDRIRRVELFAEGNPVQLQLPWPDSGLHDTAIEALRTLRGAKGLRHWTVLQRLFSVEGGRRGWVRWILDEHLEAMGYDERQIRDPKVRQDAATEIEALASLELAVYGEENQIRSRAPLLLVGNRHERLVNSQWRLDGMELRINDLLYRGVRNVTGEMGRNWIPAPTELARLDHTQHPYVHGMGLILSIRMRWRLGDGFDHLLIKGRNLLGMAGIPFNLQRPGRTWKALQRTLETLCEIGMIERYKWVEGNPWDLDGTCQIFASNWVLDRTVWGILPEERVTTDLPKTGKELKIWRETNGWSQRELARRIGITQAALSQAESQPDRMLGSRLQTRLQEPSDVALPPTDPLLAETDPSEEVPEEDYDIPEYEP